MPVRMALGGLRQPTSMKRRWYRLYRAGHDVQVPRRPHRPGFPTVCGHDTVRYRRFADVSRTCTACGIEPGCPEDWLQEGGHESGAWDVSTKKKLEALRKWTNSAIRLLLVEQQRTG